MFSIKSKKRVKKNDQNTGRQFFNSNKNPEILEVNLVKDEVVVFFDWNKHLLAVVLVFLLSSLFIFEIYLGLDKWEEQENNRALLIEQETTQLKGEIAVLNNSAKDALSYKDKASVFSDILDNHIYWTRFFSWLEQNTLSSVKYSGFSGDLSGTYTLQAVAPSYAEASWQVKAFTNSPLVKSAKVESAAFDLIELEVAEGEDPITKTEVSFDIELELDLNIFKKS